MKSVMVHNFANVPQADIPRSNFNRSHGHKTTLQADELVPIFVDEILPGDTVNMKPSVFMRMSTPIFPIMDNIKADLHWFFVPNRQLWDNWRKFMGEQTDPGDSTDFVIPKRAITTGVGAHRFEDYIGLPLGQPLEYNALFWRAYCHIYNEWYRDQNLIDSKYFDKSDAGGTNTVGALLFKRGKGHDYFTSCLPWLQKGDSMRIPLSGSADLVGVSGASTAREIRGYNPGDDAFHDLAIEASGSNIAATTNNTQGTFQNLGWTSAAGEAVSGVEVDLSSATSATINELRQAFQIQKLLERDARSGTRYSEIVKSHFGVDFYDITYRPEYLGGGSTPITVHSVPSTSDTDSDIGDLGAFATASLQGGGFVKSFTEHGILMGILSTRADLTYQQGLPRMFSRSTRYDHYFPVLAHIGEQAVLNKEIYFQGNSADDDVFGYQERWAEYRYRPSIITSAFRSGVLSLDSWHLSQEFSSLPTLNQTFMEQDTPIERVIQNSADRHFIVDTYFNYQHARPMPVYSVPGLIDHF